MRVFLVRVKQRLRFKLRVVTEDTGRPRSERDGLDGDWRERTPVSLVARGRRLGKVKHVRGEKTEGNVGERRGWTGCLAKFERQIARPSARARAAVRPRSRPSLAPWSEGESCISHFGSARARLRPPSCTLLPRLPPSLPSSPLCSLTE